jgi:hypothetical protein
VLLRELKPRRMIEVGSGYSSLLAADINHRFLASGIDLRCIEPYPPPFLRLPIAGITALIESRVEEVGLALFASLGRGDVLFIDSSHVVKTGSDVNYLIFEVLPRLGPGVVVHFHDIFLPNEYPKDWVLDEGRSWNEQYVVRALLMDSRRFKVIFGCAYAIEHHREEVRAALGLPSRGVFGGASLWIERI